MASTKPDTTKVGAYTHTRDYLRENTYLGGIIKITHVVAREYLEDEIIVSVPKGTKVTIVEQS